MFCTNCGNKTYAEDNFCGNCGKANKRTSVSGVEKPSPKIEPRPRSPACKEPEYTPPPIQPTRSIKGEARDEKKKQERKEELRKLLERERGREISDQELFDAELWLTNYANLMYDFAKTDFQRKTKLEENPKGFPLEGKGYTCGICHNSISDEQTWYDQNGLKCLTCQDALDKNIIPVSVIIDRESWYSVSDFESSFFMKPNAVRRFVKEGLLKPRIISNASGKTHFQLFLIEEHEGILPPKEVTKWPMVKFKKNGKVYYHSEPWFMHKDPKEALGSYKISEYMATLKENEIKQSYPDLSFEMHLGSESILKIDYIDEKPESAE
ncbi:MAG: zinc ribbon domain-containing protein [Candidatus Parcubacteria bacterium]|nr:zinc ribbon domain-containing protein [Candidatus Parcubacteria bacterium]